ncbi:PQQ-dependent sugar dehydrogenase [Thiosulfatihalobacter marinus]|uniref:PQQ-dependent sugar dehydrogenase n=1 Tax=Thiosulfatihalobacter marinus TaxID=2792481 RepID=UPI0018D78C76|nr:PQQ-dependent sugar dehydrogenase [Thiosulfatihalobacter marinus]
MFFKTLAILFWAVAVTGVQAEVIQTGAELARIEEMASGLRTPWGFGFLPSGEVLITERSGKLRRLDEDGWLHDVAGVPNVVARGQGGLMDILIPRDFARRREIFLTYSKRQRGGAGTAVARARLSQDGARLGDVTTILEMTPGSDGGRHFGSRLVEARDGTLFVTLGDRADPDSAQDLSRHNGSILRITRDGRAAPGNPFLGRAGVEPEIWSYGHRNPQGGALDSAGQLWAVEHGARGGDEINRIERGANYGWPVISYGVHYSGRKIGEGTARPGMKQPAYYWDPSIAPSGMMIYSGKLWPAWRGQIFVGSLKFDLISRLSGQPMQERERIASSHTIRVRDIREAPDGSIWFLSEGRGALYRLTPGG